MLLGISFTLPHASPEEWAERHAALSLSSVVFPLDHTARQKDIDEYAQAAKAQGLVIAEVGAWCNLLSPDPAEAAKMREYVTRQLELAEYVGAGCCVDISGAKGPVWDGSYPGNYAPETRDEIIRVVQDMIDRVRPKKTCFALEPMPNMLPDSPENYLELVRDIDRPAFGVHIDLVNWLSSPRAAFGNRELCSRAFSLLAPYIRSCHLKDATVDSRLTVSIREVPPGEGIVDLRHYIACADSLSPDLPMLIEHLPDEAAYRAAVRHVQKIREAAGNARQ